MKDGYPDQDFAVGRKLVSFLFCLFIVHDANSTAHNAGRLRSAAQLELGRVTSLKYSTEAMRRSMADCCGCVMRREDGRMRMNTVRQNAPSPAATAGAYHFFLLSVYCALLGGSAPAIRER